MKRTVWEYATFNVTGNIVDGLNQAGADGWEAWALIQAVPGGVQVAFRRPKDVSGLVGLDGRPM